MNRVIELCKVIDMVESGKTKPNTYKRGYAYYFEGRVRKIVSLPSSIMAVVVGSDDDYIVHLSVEDGGLRATCSCPDQRPSFCKHTVATILSIQNEMPRVKIQPKSDPAEVELSHPNVKGIGNTKISDVRIADLVWAVEHLTSVEFRQWVIRQASYKPADPRRNCGQEKQFIETGIWGLVPIQ